MKAKAKAKAKTKAKVAPPKTPPKDTDSAPIRSLADGEFVVVDSRQSAPVDHGGQGLERVAIRLHTRRTPS